MPPYLSLREAATVVGVHHTTLSRAVKRGLLSPVARTPGGYPRFTAEAVQDYAALLLTAGTPASAGTSRRRQLRSTVLLLASELRPEVVLQRLAEQARSLVQARYGALAVMEQDGAIREFYTVGFTKAQRAALGPLPQGRGLLGELFKENRTVRVAHISRHPSSVGFPPNHPPMQSLLGVPILNQGRNIGNIYLTDKVGAAEFTAEDQELVEELAQYAAVAIRNAALYQQTQRRSERWTALQAIANRITLAMEPQAILRQVVLDARTLLGVDSAFISLLHPTTGRLRTVTSSGLRRQPSQPPLTVTAGAGNIAIWGKTPLVIDDYASDDRFLPVYKQRIAAMGLVSLIVAPLEARGQALGALYLGTRRRRKFQPEEAELVGQLASLAAVVLDNARQYAAERAAHARAEQAEARLQTILQHEPEAVVVVTPDKRVLSANPAAGRLFFDNGDARMVGRRYPFGARFHKPDGTPLAEDNWPVALCLAGKGPCLGMELLLDRPRGGRTPVLVNAVRIPPSDADEGGVVAVLQDISHLKQVEQLKNDFMAMISHDLKSPLTTIKGLASSVRLDSTGESAIVPAEWPKVIEAEVDRLTELVDNLLDMSRIESGAMPLDLEECYVADLAPDCVWRVAQGDEALSGRITVEMPSDLPPVMADYLQLQRVLCNLLNNALKYSAQGTPITLRAALAGEGSLIAVEVEDRGMGIPPEEQEMVFEKFYRSQANQTRGGKSGSGLGLAICRAIVGAHGGTISVASRVGDGSTFRFELPLQVSH